MLEIAGIVAKNAAGTEQEVTYQTPLPITLAAYSSSATFTRPNDTNAYAAGDVIADSTSTPNVLTFAAIGPAGGRTKIVTATLEIDSNSIPSGSGPLRLHLYSSAPTAIADNAAFDLPSGDRAKYVGWIDLPLPTLLGSTAFSQNINDRTELPLAAGSSTLYGILQTTTAFTPVASVVRKITLSAVAP